MQVLEQTLCYIPIMYVLNHLMIGIKHSALVLKEIKSYSKTIVQKFFMLNITLILYFLMFLLFLNIFHLIPPHFEVFWHYFFFEAAVLEIHLLCSFDWFFVLLKAFCYCRALQYFITVIAILFNE